MRDVVTTFFRGSNAEAMGALLAISKDAVDDDELDRLQEMVSAARRSKDDDDA
ncbi:MAG: hypothetical protein OXP28_09535 [Gammaproteobacteria bacterium]|nr:hypothetical protein [Gammaproteobacteria bacterium]